VLTSSTDASEIGLAVDLGSGPGFQSIALAELGYSPVLAVDTSEALLSELRSRQGGLSVQTIHTDLSKLGEFTSPTTASVIVCMGDTITHLESKDAVVELLRAAYEALLPRGRFVLSYRDLSTEARGLDRFIPVYGDEGKVMTCFLEFDQADTVLVHDLIHSLAGGKWLFEKSCYRKLRLPVDWLEKSMRDIGMTVQRGQAGRLICLVGQKPEML